MEQQWADVTGGSVLFTLRHMLAAARAGTASLGLALVASSTASAMSVVPAHEHYYQAASSKRRTPRSNLRHAPAYPQ